MNIVERILHQLNILLGMILFPFEWIQAEDCGMFFLKILDGSFVPQKDIWTPVFLKFKIDCSFTMKRDKTQNIAK